MYCLYKDNVVFANISAQGYAFVWDNTQLETHVRHQDLSHQNSMMIWANAFAVRNRVEFEDDIPDPACTLKAVDMPLTQFLPTHDVYDAVRSRMSVIVQRILVEHFTALKEIPVTEDIIHDYSDQAARKSEIVSVN